MRRRSTRACYRRVMDDNDALGGILLVVGLIMWISAGWTSDARAFSDDKFRYICFFVGWALTIVGMGLTCT